MLTEELGAMSPPSHSLMAPLVHDMLCETRTRLTKAVVTVPGRAVLFYGRHSMGEGLMVDEARDATFLLKGAGTWVGKAAYLTTDSMTIHKGRRAIAQAISDNRVKTRGPGCPCVHPLAQQPFQFNSLRNSPPRDCQEMTVLTTPSHLTGHLEAANAIENGDQRPQLPRFPLPSPDHGFESDRSSLSMTSSMLSRSDHSNESRHSRWGI